METKVEEKRNKIYKMSSFLVWVIGSVIFRLILIYFPKNLNLSSRPEVSTPLTSIRRLAEGYWLKQSSMSPYAGSMYHGSPLLLSLLGPLTVKRIEGQPDHLLCSLLFVLADVMSAMLLRATGQNLQAAYTQRLKSLELHELSETSEIISSGDIAALVYLWNPFTIVACVGLSTSPIENLAIILSLYGACTRLPPLAAFGWVMATHLSLYPAILIIPLIILLGYGPDAPPRKLFLQSRCSKGGDNPLSSTSCQLEELNQSKSPMTFSGKPVIHFLLWISVWSVYVLILCRISVQQNGGLLEMFKSTYGFILTVEDLSPNMGVLWYFFAEVFEFFRDFFLIVFHVNILFMVFPLAIRLNHRPCFLAFVYIAISSMLKSYPSVGDSALYLGLLGWFVFELADMQFSFFLFCGYVGVSLLSPVMHNLWIWRGTGNANFYYATGMAFACFQIILVVESVNAILKHDRTLRKLSITKS
ncbi:phosphatidylinositol glycan anchor biosynthesis class U protein-like isoform X1 [Pistacia vera]|uniref:phosphatidylinositol glycan anchor biosynthesis class U protein-like isoform X1 n=2 Tax=Pistacia vera TaxID=55513 RepID=UPI0012632F4A|nr:phosphatidylinositol glycan anchor biosynthesis class U protein-like isoform X1 [Pistacia vera]